MSEYITVVIHYTIDEISEMLNRRLTEDDVIYLERKLPNIFAESVEGILIDWIRTLLEY